MIFGQENDEYNSLRDTKIVKVVSVGDSSPGMQPWPNDPARLQHLSRRKWQKVVQYANDANSIINKCLFL